MTHPLAGKWRIVEMELWNREFIDLLGLGSIAFDDQGGGEFCFGAVTGTLDCGYARASIHFTWEECDEMDEASGDGYAELQDDGSVTGESSSTMAMNSRSSRRGFFNGLLVLLRHKFGDLDVVLAQHGHR